VLLRTEALRQVGTLDERFFIFFEDTDLCERLRWAGWESAVCEKASIVHHGHMTVALASAGSVWEWQMLRSQYLYFCKHRGRLAGLRLSGLVRGALLIRATKALAMSTLNRDRSERETANLLIDLVKYDPWKRLPHEIAI
jgi:GT2 family glycosyltransferase